MNALSPQRKRTVIVAALAGLGMIALAGGGLATSLKSATAVTPPTTVDQVFAMPSLAGVVEAVSPAVVSIEVRFKAQPALTTQQWRGHDMPDFLQTLLRRRFRRTLRPHAGIRPRS